MPEFQVLKDRFTECRIVEDAPATPALADGQIRVRVERFAYTANNVTYAATGDRIGYWQFFPPGGDDSSGWGIIPVWGFAEITESRSDGLPVGERLFGYFPPATTLDLVPVNVSDAGFVDGAPHRASLPPGYNRYQRVAAEPGYNQAGDGLRMLLWPLHITSFCLWDALQDNDWYGAEQLVIISASSKTSIGLAYALDDDASSPPVIGITSQRNQAFVDGLGLYSESLSYEELDQIDKDKKTVIVDMAGNAGTLSALHTRLGDNMRRCINVGLTHWGDTGSSDGMIRERSEFFFAPAHIQKRFKDWGPDGFAKKTSGFVASTAARSRDWLELTEVDGLAGLAAVHADVCSGQVDASKGLIVSM